MKVLKGLRTIFGKAHAKQVRPLSQEAVTQQQNLVRDLERLGVSPEIVAGHQEDLDTLTDLRNKIKPIEDKYRTPGRGLT